jgi:hypothetical protein
VHPRDRHPDQQESGKKCEDGTPFHVVASLSDGCDGNDLPHDLSSAEGTMMCLNVSDTLRPRLNTWPL